MADASGRLRLVIVLLLYFVDFSSCWVIAISASALLCTSELLDSSLLALRLFALTTAAGLEPPIASAKRIVNTKSARRGMAFRYSIIAHPLS